MSAQKTARIERRERRRNAFTAPANWRGGVSYEWVILLPGDRRKITRTRREATEWCAEMGYELQ
jgi:hypothetical protein